MLPSTASTIHSSDVATYWVPGFILGIGASSEAEQTKICAFMGGDESIHRITETQHIKGDKCQGRNKTGKRDVKCGVCVLNHGGGHHQGFQDRVVRTRGPKGGQPQEL